MKILFRGGVADDIKMIPVDGIKPESVTFNTEGYINNNTTGNSNFLKAIEPIKCYYIYTDSMADDEELKKEGVDYIFRLENTSWDIG